MEEIGATNPIASFMASFVRPRSKTILLAPIQSFTRQIVPGIVGPKILQIPYKLLPSIKIIIARGYARGILLFVLVSSHTPEIII